MADAGTETIILRCVGETVKIISVLIASPVYVAENDPDVTEVDIALKVPFVEINVEGVKTPPELLKVTGIFTLEPETRVTPVATEPKDAVVAPNSVKKVCDEFSVAVYPSGAVTITENLTELVKFVGKV